MTNYLEVISPDFKVGFSSSFEDSTGFVYFSVFSVFLSIGKTASSVAAAGFGLTASSVAAFASFSFGVYGVFFTRASSPSSFFLRSSLERGASADALVFTSFLPSFEGVEALSPS